MHVLITYNMHITCFNNNIKEVWLNCYCTSGRQFSRQVHLQIHNKPCLKAK